MCGIALIISGIRINLSSLLPNHISPIPHLPPQTLLSVDDIKEALRRRGPDSLGSKTVFIHSKVSSHEQEIVSEIDDLRNESEEREVENDFGDGKLGKLGKLEFTGATLQLRGVDRIVQPLVDASGNILVYNGEIFGGIDIGSDSNDTEILMQNMGQCCTCNCHEYDTNHYSCGESQNSVPELLSKIKGPWALIYWQDSSKTLWFGRDAFGRRSLLVHWPTTEDPRLLLSSVSPLPSINGNSEFGDAKIMAELDFWEELSCGVYSICMGAAGIDGDPVGEVKKHQWADPSLQELIRWERSSIQPNPEELYVSREKFSGRQQYFHAIRSIRMHSDSAFPSYLAETVLWPSERLLIALKESVKQRTALSTIYKEAISDCSYEGCAPVGVLFSGGLDSMILAALLHQCIDAKYEIDLLNVSFDGNCAPDRISARAGVKELEKIAPSRRWKLVEIDSDLLRLTFETKLVMSLINPAKTYMDLNIGIALWLAAGGDGLVYEGESNNNSMDCHRVKYKSNSRILLVGSGADEQCAGYGRHRTKYRHGSWVGLHEEMRLDMQRIWKRNLGRDDRCIADNGKEARFPFLDENVIRMLLDLPLWEIADLDQPSGIGDKKILREVAQLLGLYEAAVLPKRAIQFGSRIARESNRKNFGSNRAANQANAGSVAIYGPSN